MTAVIAMLRGVNVLGRNKVSMHNASFLLRQNNRWLNDGLRLRDLATLV